MADKCLRLTLIVPVFNAERHLPEFLDSLVKQSRFPDEIIFVNDGSKDRSLQILTEFSWGKPQVRIIDQENVGAGKARNRAIDAASFDLIGFADADDILKPRIFETICSEFDEQPDLEVVVVNGQSFWSDGREGGSMIRSASSQRRIDGQTWITERLNAKNFDHYAWLYYVRRDFLQRHEIRFSEGVGHEDVLWVTQLVLFAECLAFINEELYKYRQRDYAIEHVPLRSRVADLESAIFNTMGIANLLRSLPLRKATFEQLRQELINGGCSKSHEFRRLADKETRKMIAASMLRSNWFDQLWANAKGLKEHFKVLKAWLRTKRASI